MALPAPTNLKEYQGRKMSDTERDIQTLKEFHRVLRRTLRPHVYSVFCAIEDRAGSKAAPGLPAYTCFAADTTLAVEASVSRATVMRSVKELADSGLVKTQERIGETTLIWPLVSNQEYLIYIEANQGVLHKATGRTKRQGVLQRVTGGVAQSDTNETNVTKPINETNNSTTSVVEAAAPPADIDFEVDSLVEPAEETIPEVLLPDTFEATKPGPATDKGRAKVRDKPKPKGKEPDPNSSHPACLIWQETHNKKLPNVFQMVDIVAQVGDEPANLDEWRECLVYYARHPHWNQVDSDKILHCYKNQNYKKGETYGQGGNGKQGFGKNGTGPAGQGAGSYGRSVGKFSALGPSGRLTDEQLEDAW